MTELDRRDWLLLAGLTILAAALRFYQLGAVPPGFQFDEAYNALDAARVMAGDRPLFLPTNGGREVLYTYYQAALGSLFGLNLTTLRLASALAGIATVPVAYLLVRTLLQQDSRRVAAFTALVLATSLWHLHFSHYGIRIILMPLILSGVFGFFWIGVTTNRLWPYVASGALAGLGVWNNPTGRLVPLVLGAFAIWLLWQHPELRHWRWPGLIAGLLVTGGVAFLVFLPLGLEFLRHPEFFLGHPGEVSVFADRVGGGSPLAALARHAWEVLAMFSVRGDEEWIHNLAGRPVFDLLLSIPFLIGVVLWVRR
ncbi:MAG: ArnT family glycosyltransferase, partial [Anaerolineae bacterium]